MDEQIGRYKIPFGNKALSAYRDSAGKTYIAHYHIYRFLEISDYAARKALPQWEQTGRIHRVQFGGHERLFYISTEELDLLKKEIHSPRPALPKTED